jgi:hypothetical protein
MSPLKATVVRTWTGVSGKFWAHALVDNTPITVSRPTEFTEGERFEVEKVGHEYVVKGQG